MQIEWLETATNEFESAIAWLEERNTTAANDLARNALFQIDQLKHFPLIGRVGRDSKTRELIITHSRYIAVYRIISNQNLIALLAFKHEAILWPEEF